MFQIILLEITNWNDFENILDTVKHVYVKCNLIVDGLCLSLASSGWSAAVRGGTRMTRLLPGAACHRGGRPPAHMATSKWPARGEMRSTVPHGTCRGWTDSFVWSYQYNEASPVSIWSEFNYNLVFLFFNYIVHSYIWSGGKKGGNLILQEDVSF